MTGLRVVLGVIWLLALLAGRELWGSDLPSPFAATSAEITGPAFTPAHGPAPRIDLFGNEVDDALADYRFDTGGDIYERHSPETAVPRLGSPTT